MHLEFSRSTYKGNVYTSYRIARSVRRSGKVQKEVLFKLGALTDEQVRQIRLILRAVTRPEDLLVVLDAVIPTSAVRYLDVAIANQLWDDWELDVALPQSTDSEVSTKQIARILTINRCVEPCSHYRIPRWIERTALPEILGIDTARLNDDKIYYELDKIEENKAQIEKHIRELTLKRNPRSYDFVNYDLSSSYFVGLKCGLSRFGRGKDLQSYQRQVVLAILVNSDGYPFKWDVFPGNTAEVHTLQENIDACRELGVKGVTMVFDRGLVSKANLKLLQDTGDEGEDAIEEVKFISALDKPQIPKVEGLDLRLFRRISEKNAERDIRALSRWKAFDEKVFYRDLGVIGELRHVLSMNVELLRVERKLRRQKLRQFERFLQRFNADLKTARHNREEGPTRRAVESQLKKLKLTRFFGEPVLKQITVKRTLKDGTKKPLTSFQVKLTKKPDTIAEAKLLDGLCVFISNHVAKRGRGYAMRAERIIQAYRDKTEIEDAFKNMKSFLKIRPFFVNTDEHVRAVFTICVLAYHLNKTLALRRKEIEGKDYLNSHELYDPFRESRLVTLKDPETNTRTSKVIPPSRQSKELLRQLGLANLLNVRM
jgi:transposase